MNLQLGQMERKDTERVEIFSLTTTQPAKSVVTSRRFPINNIIIITSSSRLSHTKLSVVSVRATSKQFILTGPKQDNAFNVKMLRQIHPEGSDFLQLVLK